MSLRTLWPALLAGAGVAGTLDEVVLHQLLRWHHFYDGNGPGTGQVTDGIFHLASTVALVVGVLVARGRPELRGRRLWGGVAAGAGAFNLWDATIQHKVLRLHQVRPEAADQLPYDLAFGGLAVVVLVVGVVVVRSARGGPPAASLGRDRTA